MDGRLEVSCNLWRQLSSCNHTPTAGAVSLKLHSVAEDPLPKLRTAARAPVCASMWRCQSMVLHGNRGDLATPSDGRERSSSDMVKFHSSSPVNSSISLMVTLRVLIFKMDVRVITDLLKRWHLSFEHSYSGSPSLVFTANTSHSLLPTRAVPSLWEDFVSIRSPAATFRRFMPIPSHWYSSPSKPGIKLGLPPLDSWW